MDTFKKIFIAIFSLVIVSCGGGDEPDTPPTPEVKNPEPALLVLPLKNEECNQGSIVSDTQSKVKFEWNKADNTNTYNLIIKNLSTNEEDENTTSNTTLTKTLSRGTSYSWKVISISNSSTKTATSEIWNFYNAGEAVVNYAPFPAEVVSPPMGGLTSSEVTLKWNGSDLDNDIESYDVYLSSNTPPTELYTSTPNSNVPNIILNSNMVYYWSIVTKDSFGNNSQSPIFEFRTQ